MRMNRFRIVNFYGFFVLGFFSSVATQICDERSYTLDSEPRRSVEAVFDEAFDLALCDDWINEGTWYRFSSNTGDRIVERAANNPVPMFRCGTRAPIYIRGLGSHPVTDFANTTATVCATYEHDACGWIGRIRIHRCPAQGNSSYYFLYKLQAPTGCSLSYCVGEDKTCNRGYNWNGSSCVNSFPAMKGFPIFSGPHVNGSGWSKEIYFRCQVQYDRQPNDSNARFRVTFLFDGLPIENIGANANSPPERLEPIILSPESDLTAILDESHLRGRLGREISCQAESYWSYNGSKANSSSYMTSVAKYYAAFESTAGSYDIRLTNGSTHIVTFRSTLPLTCSHSVNSTSCRYKFRMMKQSVAMPQCSVDWTDNDTASVTVYFVPGATQEGKSFALVFNPYNDDQTTARRSLWRDYVVPPVTMTVVPQSAQYLSCYSVGDPHLKTFDDVYFSNYMVGDFYLVRAKNSENLMEIQVRHEICNGAVTCNCGVVVREGNSAFKISVCEKGPWSFAQRSPTVVRLLSQHPADSSTVYTDGTGLIFSVRMPSGLRVEADLRAPWFSIYVYLPPVYHGKTDSLSMCGNSNGSNFDDFSTNLEQFRIPDSLSYFRQQPGCSSIFNPTASWCGCNKTNTGNSPVCSNSDPTLPMISASNTPYPIRWTTGVVCHNITNQRKRRDATPQDDSENDFILDNDILFPPYKYDPNFGVNASFSWPTPKGKTEQQVEQYCKDTLRSSPAHADCKAHANLSTIVDMCKSDVQIADDWISVSAYASAFEQNCLNNIAASINSSSNSSSSNSTLEVLTLVSGKVCPNRCSGHGNCSEGNCTCTTGYIGADCSINQSRPPSTTGIIRGGVCDVSKRPCDVISVFGSGVVFSSAIKCRFTDINTGAYAETDGTFITAVEYSCPVPETTTHRRRRSVTTRTTAMSVKNVSITTDGVHYSNPLGFVLFDSVCMECSNSDTCRQKNESCLIRGECSADGAFNPDDSCLQCVPSVSRNSWTNTAVASNWSSCTRNCDVGVATRNAVCRYGFTKKEVQFCKVLDCPDNKEEETQGVGITLASSDLQKILLDPARSLASITDALNQFCSKNAAACCTSIGMKTRIFDVTYTSSDLVTYAPSYPVINTTDASLKIIVKIDREKLSAGCSRTRTKGSNIVYADPKLIYDVVNSKKNDIEQALSIKITSVWSSAASSSATSHTCTTFSIVYSLVGFLLFVTALERNSIA